MIYNIFLAAAHGDVETVKILLDAGTDVNVRNETGLTPLAIAIATGQQNVVDLLLSRGASPTVTDHNVPAVILAADHPEIRERLKAAAGTNLHDAAKRGDIAVVQALLGENPDVDRQDEKGRTALLVAAEAGQEHVVRFLLDRHAAVDARDLYSRTPLLVAISKGHVYVSSLLIASGADVNAANMWNQTPLLLATVNRHADIATQLISAGAHAGLAETALLGDVDAVFKRLDAGEDVNTSGPGGVTALMAVAREEDPGFTGALLSRGADINALDGQGRTALAWAVGAGRMQIARLLLDRGADVNLAGKQGHTPLQGAVMSRNAPMMRLLLERGADPNHSDGQGYTPLHWIAMSRPELTAEIAPMLAQMGIEPGAETEAEVMQTLLDAGADLEAKDAGLGWTPLQVAVEMGTFRAVRHLLDAGANPNVETNFGGTPLSAAAEKGDTDMVQALLFAGADVNHQRGNVHQTALGAAAREGDEDSVRLLLEHGAEVSPGEEGLDPLVEAAAGGHARVVRLLLDHGADVTGVRAMPAMLLASMHGHQEVAEMLRAAIEEKKDHPS